MRIGEYALKIFAVRQFVLHLLSKLWIIMQLKDVPFPHYYCTLFEELYNILISCHIQKGVRKLLWVFTYSHFQFFHLRRTNQQLINDMSSSIVWDHGITFGCTKSQIIYLTIVGWKSLHCHLQFWFRHQM